MKFKVSLKNFEIKSVENFEELEGVKTNSQHQQLLGYALVDFNLNAGEMSLLHPETEPCTGGVDVYFKPSKSVWLQTYSREPLKKTEMDSRWPTGLMSLLGVIHAVEKYLSSHYSYTLQLDGLISPILEGK